MGMGMNTGGRSSGIRRSRGRGYSPTAEINVTPLVDVMLVLLIVFMVAAPLLTTGVAVDLPNSAAKAIQDQDNTPIEITVKDDGATYIGETEVKDGNLITLLRAMTEGQDDRRIYIRGDQALSYGKGMSVIGAVNGAGFNKVALISEREG